MAFGSDAGWSLKLVVTMCSVDMPWPVVGQCGAVLGQCGAGEGGAGPLILTLVHIRTYFPPCRAQRPRSNLPRRLIRWSTLSVLICPPPPGDTTPPHLVLRTLHIVCCRVSAGSLLPQGRHSPRWVLPCLSHHVLLASRQPGLIH